MEEQSLGDQVSGPERRQALMDQLDQQRSQVIADWPGFTGRGYPYHLESLRSSQLSQDQMIVATADWQRALQRVAEASTWLVKCLSLKDDSASDRRIRNQVLVLLLDYTQGCESLAEQAKADYDQAVQQGKMGGFFRTTFGASP